MGMECVCGLYDLLSNAEVVISSKPKPLMESLSRLLKVEGLLSKAGLCLRVRFGPPRGLKDLGGVVRDTVFLVGLRSSARYAGVVEVA